MTIGVLALQGDVREHLTALTRLGVDTLAVRRPSDLERCAALVLPGGESTTIAKLARIFGLIEPLRERIAAGMPALGTCAGMILLADRITDGTADQETFGGLDITVRRNAFGRQIDSFETELAMHGLTDPVHAVFIRAPWVEQIGPDVEVLARVPGAEPDTELGGPRGGGAVEAGPVTGLAAGRIVAVRQGPLLATSFHPEFGGGDRVHAMFVQAVTSLQATDTQVGRPSR